MKLGWHTLTQNFSKYPPPSAPPSPGGGHYAMLNILSFKKLYSHRNLLEKVLEFHSGSRGRTSYHDQEFQKLQCCDFPYSVFKTNQKYSKRNCKNANPVTGETRSQHILLANAKKVFVKTISVMRRNSGQCKLLTRFEKYI